MSRRRRVEGRIAGLLARGPRLLGILSRNSARTLGQGFGARAGGLLDGAGVVVLVARQGRAASKGLLAVNIRAFVRPRAQVNAAVAGQRAAVAKGLWTMSANLHPTHSHPARLPDGTARTGAASRRCAPGNALSERSAG